MLHCNCKENLVFDPFLQLKPPNLQHLMMDATLLLPITGTPLTGIEFYKRLPCGEVEHTRRVRQTHITRTLFCYFAQVVKQENNLFRLGHLVLLEFRKNSGQLEQSTVVRTLHANCGSNLLGRYKSTQVCKSSAQLSEWPQY